MKRKIMKAFYKRQYKVWQFRYLIYLMTGVI